MLFSIYKENLRFIFKVGKQKIIIFALMRLRSYLKIDNSAHYLKTPLIVPLVQSKSVESMRLSITNQQLGNFLLLMIACV